MVVDLCKYARMHNGLHLISQLLVLVRAVKSKLRGCTLCAQASGEEAAKAEVSNYLLRGKRTPFMERKLRALQARHPTDLQEPILAIYPLHMRTPPLLCKRVPFACAKPPGHMDLQLWQLLFTIHLQAMDWADKDLGKVHKSRLEREKEAAAAARSALA